ncbi:hypothetical protein D3C87_977330 [compost metagenome]
MKSRMTFVTTLLLCLMGASCENGKVPEARATWERVLLSCGVSDLQKSKPLYFGAANGNGVGSIWALDGETGDYFPASQLTDVTSRKDIVFMNAELACAGEVKSGVDFQVGVSAKPVVYPVSGEMQSTFNNAVSAKVSVSSIVQEDAYWDRFNQEFKKLPANGVIMDGVALNNRFVVGRAWKIKGFKAVLGYQGDNAASAKAALDAKVASGSLGISVKLTDNNTLEISSTQDLYVAGVLRKLSPGGVLAGTAETVSDWVPVLDNAKINPPR